MSSHCRGHVAARRPHSRAARQGAPSPSSSFNSGELRGCPGNLEAAFALGVDALAELGALAGDKACEQHVALKREKRSTVNGECYVALKRETRYQLLSPRVRARANALGKRLTGSLAVPRGRRGQRNGLVYHAGFTRASIPNRGKSSSRHRVCPPGAGPAGRRLSRRRATNSRTHPALAHDVYTTCYKELMFATTTVHPRDRGARIRAQGRRWHGWDGIIRCVCVHDQ
jgi:hypothetical protein